MSAERSAAMVDRCGNTIHSDYVTDHRCQLPRGHVGDCLFGRPAGNLVEIAHDFRFSDEYVGNVFRGQYGRSDDARA